ncbi:hypothetical protein MMC28_000600 [Mycoblastus sanguinarius]|nr:hypothetical protein [Mycoblastus sanguinarius]
MDSTSSRTLKRSGIPRLSRLPVTQASEHPCPSAIPVKYNLKSRGLPGKALQEIRTDAASAGADGQPASQTEHLLEHRARDEPGFTLENSNSDQPRPPSKACTLPRRPRLSLSDRTIETLSQIPPSPSPRRRRSSFFLSESPIKSTSRPASSLSRSRPSTSHGHHPPLPSGFPTPRSPSPTKRQLAPIIGNQSQLSTPSKRAISSYVPDSLPHPRAKLNDAITLTPSKAQTLRTATITNQNPGANVTHKASSKQLRGSKTLAVRPSRQRPSVQDAFQKPHSKVSDMPKPRVAEGRKKISPTPSAKSAETASTFSPPSKRSSRTSSESAGTSNLPPGMPDLPKGVASSAALRETIAQAKAARRNAYKAQLKGETGSKQRAEDFPEVEVGGSNKGLLRKRIAMARADGRLNIAALGLAEIPPEVMKMYDSETVGPGDGAWYESVDLVRMVAADNEIEHISDQVFPDVAAGASSGDDDDCQGNMFGGLETLDLHGNRLRTLPLGLRRLEHLTTLNISKNRLGNDSLDVISKVESLREVRLAENSLNGTLAPQLCTLKRLEILDIQSNAINILPDDIQNLTNLRILLASGNRLNSLPFETLSYLPLLELNAARNNLNGLLFPPRMKRLASLKTLDVSYNALTSMTDGSAVDLPSIQSLNVTENRLAALPNLSGWTELLSLVAGGNKLISVPDGIDTLRSLKTVDVSRNDIRKLDERLGLMENLAILRVANNPLRERKFLTMDTHDLKRELRSRLQPEDSPHDLGDKSMSQMASHSDNSLATIPTQWPVQPGGILDRSSTRLSALENSDLEPLVQESNIKNINLHHNLLRQIPQAIVLTAHSLTTLDLSHNQLTGNAYLSTALSFPHLRSLDLSTNTITVVNPLLDFLSAPKLSELNVCRNRLTSIPRLRDTFPSLVSLLASDNKISELQVEAVRGLQVLDVNGNEIGHLEPNLGLLGVEGLRTLLISGNTFRVPRRDVVDKGTEAVLAWLKSRIPEEDLHGLE